jgi:hypothetical protein
MSHKHTDSCKQPSGLKRRRRKKSASELAKAHKLQGRFSAVAGKNQRGAMMQEAPGFL